MTRSRFALSIVVVVALMAGGGVYWASSRAHARIDALAHRIDNLDLEAQRLPIPRGVAPSTPTNLIPPLDAAPASERELSELLAGDHALAPLATDRDLTSLGFGRRALQARRELAQRVRRRAERQVECGAAAVDSMRFAAALDAVSDGRYTTYTRWDTEVTELTPVVLDCADQTPPDVVRDVADALERLADIETPRRHLIHDRRETVLQLGAVRERTRRDTWAMLNPDRFESLDVIERALDQLEALAAGVPLARVPHRMPDDDIERAEQAQRCTQLRLRVLAGALRMRVGEQRPLEGLVDPYNGMNIVQRGDTIASVRPSDTCAAEILVAPLDARARLDRLVRARWARIMACKSTMQVAGTLALRLRLAEGNAAQVQVVDNQTNDDEIGGCVARELETWRLPVLDDDELNYTLTF